MSLAQILAGNIIYADDIQDELDAIDAKIPVVVLKTSSSQVRNASTTFLDDDALFFSLAANENRTFRARIIYESNATADFKYCFTFPAGATCTWSEVGVVVAGSGTGDGNWFAFSTATSGSSFFSVGANAAGNATVVDVEGTIRNGATAGTVQLQWSQNTSTAVDTFVDAGSTLTHQLIS